MKVSDILRVKGSTLYTVTPDEPLARAIEAMSEKDIGSLVVMEHGDLVGMLTFREVPASPSQCWMPLPPRGSCCTAPPIWSGA